MKLVVRRPGVGYIDNWLWLPKTHTASVQIESALLYEGRNAEAIEAWVEEPHHFRVPRNYLVPGALGRLPYPVVDTRVTQFPRVSFRSRVSLDAREPDKTYQRDGSAALLNTYDGILCLRCGAGKTVVALHSAAMLRTPILVVVTDKGLARQWIDAITQFLDVEESEIGRIGGDNSRFDWKRRITVAIVNSLARRAQTNTLPPEMTRWFGVVICDEAHVMGAPYFNSAIPPFHGRRWGLSATPEREDEFDSLLRHTMGDVVYTYLAPDLKPKVYFVQLNTTLKLSDPYVLENTHSSGGEFHHMMTYGYLAREKHTRTDEIVTRIREAMSHGRQVLVLTHSRDMCDALSLRLPEAGVCHGGVREGERIRRIRECNPVIAIMQLGKQALDKPSLDTLFITEPFRKSGVLQQTMGRVLRTFSGKRDPVVVFFEDRYIKELHKMCNKLRTQLARWPEHKGGRIENKKVK